MIQQQNSETDIKIIDAATEIFLQKGKDGARMQEIADKAGINKALLHYYFRSKDKLFEKVFYKEVRTMLNTTIDSVTDTDNFKEWLRLFIHNYIDNVTLRKKLYRFILWESEYFMKNVTDQFIHVFKSFGFKQNPIIIEVKKAVAEGQIRKLDPDNFALSLISMCLFPIVATPVLGKIVTELDINDQQFWEKRKEEIFNLIWNGVKP